MSDISDKQLEANRQNAKLGGVKTDEGKAISRLNAVKHGILNNIMVEEETRLAELIHHRLTKEFQPQTYMEEFFIERITVWSVRLQRAIRAEAEAMRGINDPTLVEEHNLMPSFTQVEVVKQGYKPKISEEQVQQLTKTYLRYESALERNLTKALHELQRIQAVRNGGVVPPPLIVDINVSEDSHE